MVFPKQFSNGIKDFSTINTDVKICVECGSTLISIEENFITCRECGAKKNFENQLSNLVFKPGETVKIVDVSGKESIPYTIKKVKRLEGGELEYLLKSESNPISLLYHENEKSKLEKVQ